MSDRASGAPREEGTSLFVGRGREMATLRTALDAAVSGQGGIVILAGEAGIGKSRLAEALADEVRTLDVGVAWGRCWEAGGAPAYWPWVGILRALMRSLDDAVVEHAFAASGHEVSRVLPELRADHGLEASSGAESGAPWSEDGAAVRFELFDAIAQSLRALSAACPLLLVLEDLHAADEPSILLLRFVCGELSDAPILFLATYREGELEPTDPRLAQLVELGRQPGMVHVSPRALNEESVRQYLELAVPEILPAGLADTVHRQTEGNPLFMTEVVRLLVDEHRVERMSADGTLRLEIPEGIRAVIGRRLTRLSEASRTVLDRAAVIGVEVTLESLTDDQSSPTETVLGWLDEAARADVLIPPLRAGGAWRFKHALIREVVYTSLPATERMRLHLELAEYLERLHGSDPDPPLSTIAHHYLEAVPNADPGKAIDYSRRAARQASDQAAHEEAMRLYRRALSIAEARDAVRVDLLIGWGEAATRAGDVIASRKANLEAADIAERLELFDDLARAAVGYGGRFAWVRAGTDHFLIPLLERALDALADSDSRLRVRLLARLAGALRSEASMLRRDELSEAALSMARRLADPITLTFALSSRYWSIAGPDAIVELRALSDELTSLTAMTRDQERICDAHLTRYDLLATTGGDHAAMRAEVDAYGRLGEALRQPAMIWYHSVLRTIFAINEGDLVLADRLIDEGHRLGERTLERDAAVSRQLETFAVRREQGRLEEYGEGARRAAVDYPDYPLFRCIALFIDSQTDDAAVAQRVLERIADDEYRLLPRDMGWLFGMTCLAEAALALGDHERALDIEQRLAPYASLFAIATDEINAGPVSRTLGLIAAMDGRLDESIELLEAAERSCAKAGIRTFETRTMVEIAKVLSQRGRPEDVARSRHLAATALRICRALGLAAIEAMAREVLAHIDGSAKATDATAPGVAGDQSVTSFYRNGDAWQVGDQRVFHLHHSKGLLYLSMLLQTPGREHHVLDLVSATSPGVGEDPRREPPAADVRLASQAIPEGGLDDQAREAYRERLKLLAAELEEAESAGDGGRAEQAGWEIETLTRELGVAYGLGGRARPQGSPAERARQSVTKAIREAVRRIEREDPELGAHLDRAVRTGVFCAYDPDPSARRSWRLSSS